MQPVYIAKRPFGPHAGDAWTRYLTWSGLSHLQEVVSLDTMLCPIVPEELTAADWDYNVHADYQVFFFRSLEYLRQRVNPCGRLNILAVLQNPTAAELEASSPPGFTFAGFDLVDVCGDVSALTNCGGFTDVFVNTELSAVGLLSNLSRAREVQASLRVRYPGEAHSECDVWAIWRERLAAPASA